MQQHLDGQSREDGCVDAHIADTLMTPTLFSQHSYSLKCCKIWWKHQWTVQHFGELLTFCFRYEHINTVLSGKKLSPWPTKGPKPLFAPAWAQPMQRLTPEYLKLWCYMNFERTRAVTSLYFRSLQLAGSSDGDQPVQQCCSSSACHRRFLSHVNCSIRWSMAAASCDL